MTQLFACENPPRICEFAINLKRMIEDYTPEVVLVDLEIPDTENGLASKTHGLELLRFLEPLPWTTAITLTRYGEAQGQQQDIIAAMKAGSDEYVIKAWLDLDRGDIDFLRVVIDGQMELLRRSVAIELEDLNYPSRAMQLLYSTVRSMFPDVPHLIVIQGELGAGKHRLAHLIHRCLKRKRICPVECERIGRREQFLECMLGGADRAGYLEAADGGSIVISNFDKIPQDVRTETLDFFTTLFLGNLTRTGKTEFRTTEGVAKRCDVQYFLLSETPFKQLLDTNYLSQPLYEILTLEGVVLDVPPLRERNDDFVQLIEEFLVKSHRRAIRDVIHLDEWVGSLQARRWPTNISGLKTEVAEKLHVPHDSLEPIDPIRLEYHVWKKERDERSLRFERNELTGREFEKTVERLKKTYPLVLIAEEMPRANRLEISHFYVDGQMRTPTPLVKMFLGRLLQDAVGTRNGVETNGIIQAFDVTFAPLQRVYKVVHRTRQVIGDVPRDTTKRPSKWRYLSNKRGWGYVWETECLETSYCLVIRKMDSRDE